jgi:hypothetical protein
MTTHIEEGALMLEIDSDRVLKWDEDKAFVEGLKRREGTKAVDICADVDGEDSVYLELKDFRASAIENKGRLRSNELAREVAEKVRDTLAGLVWACGRGLGEPFHEQLTRRYLETPKALVVLWLEEDGVDIGGANALQDRIRAELKPHIEARVIVTSSLLEKRSNRPLGWLRAHGLPSERIAKRTRRRPPGKKR